MKAGRKDKKKRRIRGKKEEKRLIKEVNRIVRAEQYTGQTIHRTKIRIHKVNNQSIEFCFKHSPST